MTGNLNYFKMTDKYKKFAQFLLDYFHVEIKLDNVDFKIIDKEFKRIEEQELQELLKLNKPGLMYISWQIADYFGYDSLIVIEGKGRKRELTEPRQLCYYIANKEYNYGPSEIAKFFGGNTVNGTKNHATILHGIKTIQNLIDTDKNYKLLVETLIHKIKNGSTNQRLDTTTGTQSISRSSEQKGNNLSVDRNREIEDSDRLYQKEFRHPISIDHITANKS
jgi:hypothetical protein